MTAAIGGVPVPSDEELLDWLESKMACGRVLFSTSRVTGQSSLHEVRGDTKGAHSVREELARAIYREKRKRLGFKP